MDYDPKVWEIETDPAGVVTLKKYNGKEVQPQIPACIQVIGAFAFSGCTGLTELHLPELLTSNRRYAFDGCSDLTELNLPVSPTAPVIGYQGAGQAFVLIEHQTEWSSLQPLWKWAKGLCLWCGPVTFWRHGPNV